ncbi:bifunctional transcriptional activator/DNA repair enzyme AdaA [Pseudomonas massiliensis]|uniref:bifunctional transcriptional activator/DNA repair enzyme AdaA n=1 Tax=Pseudomonas massiliensis TaxID=522492 RepID=UPI000A542435|nr:methylated-DNA--[protein]-cysteine S-methyltransferase [Pseudomonas massiliensis]
MTLPVACPTARPTHLEVVTEACRYIETQPRTPSLRSLADRARLSPWHFQRVFKAITGLSPKAYALAARAKRAEAGLAGQGTITDALYEAGFGSNGRFYETAPARLGMTPTTRRLGGAGAEIHFAVGQCNLGAILVARGPKGICAILLGDDPEQLLMQFQDRFPQAHLIGADTEFEALVARVVGFVQAPGLGLDLPLDLQGTVFQERVWRALRDIAPGQTVSYAELARRIGEPTAVRAVARACAANNLAVAIPCHRVVRSDGGLSGYRWGVERKKTLLALELDIRPN